MSTDTSPINVAELPVSLSAAGMELLATDAQNEIRRIDAAVFGAHTIAVKSRLTAIPPSTPESGDAYIVPSTGVASWGQPAGTLVVWNGSEWEVTAPSVGAPVWIQDERVQVVFDGEWENPTADASGAIAALVDGAPTGLDTLKKIADAIGLLAPKASPAFTDTPTAPTADAGTNTTQVATTAFVATAISALLNGAPAGFDTLKEISDAIALLAPKTSPALTGSPTAPTADAGTNTTQVATTAFVATAISALLNGAPAGFDTLKEISDAIALLAPKTSPALTGSPTAPTADAGTNTTQVATTAFVATAISALLNGAPAGFDTLKEISDAIALLAPKTSPALTGSPTAPTADAGTNTTQVATTAFVATAISALLNGAPTGLDTLKEIADALDLRAALSGATFSGSISWVPPVTAPAFTTNGQTALYAVSDTDVRLRRRGSDGTSRDIQLGGVTALATSTADGLMSAVDKNKLDHTAASDQWQDWIINTVSNIANSTVAATVNTAFYIAASASGSWGWGSLKDQSSCRMIVETTTIVTTCYAYLEYSLDNGATWLLEDGVTASTVANATSAGVAVQLAALRGNTRTFTPGAAIKAIGDALRTRLVLFDTTRTTGTQTILRSVIQAKPNNILGTNLSNLDGLADGTTRLAMSTAERFRMAGDTAVRARAPEVYVRNRNVFDLTLDFGTSNLVADGDPVAWSGTNEWSKVVAIRDALKVSHPEGCDLSIPAGRFFAVNRPVPLKMWNHINWIGRGLAADDSGIVNLASDGTSARWTGSCFTASTTSAAVWNPIVSTGSTGDMTLYPFSSAALYKGQDEVVVDSAFYAAVQEGDAIDILGPYAWYSANVKQLNPLIFEPMIVVAKGSGNRIRLHRPLSVDIPLDVNANSGVNSGAACWLSSMTGGSYISGIVASIHRLSRFASFVKVASGEDGSAAAPDGSEWRCWGVGFHNLTFASQYGTSFAGFGSDMVIDGCVFDTRHHFFFYGNGGKDMIVRNCKATARGGIEASVQTSRSRFEDLTVTPDLTAHPNSTTQSQHWLAIAFKEFADDNVAKNIAFNGAGWNPSFAVGDNDSTMSLVWMDGNRNAAYHVSGVTAFDRTLRAITCDDLGGDCGDKAGSYGTFIDCRITSSAVVSSASQTLRLLGRGSFLGGCSVAYGSGSTSPANIANPHTTTTGVLRGGHTLIDCDFSGGFTTAPTATLAPVSGGAALGGNTYMRCNFSSVSNATIDGNHIVSCGAGQAVVANWTGDQDVRHRGEVITSETDKLRYSIPSLKTTVAALAASVAANTTAVGTVSSQVNSNSGAILGYLGASSNATVAVDALATNITDYVGSAFVRADLNGASYIDFVANLAGSAAAADNLALAWSVDTDTPFTWKYFDAAGTTCTTGAAAPSDMSGMQIVSLYNAAALTTSTSKRLVARIAIPAAVAALTSTQKRNVYIKAVTYGGAGGVAGSTLRGAGLYKVIS